MNNKKPILYILLSVLGLILIYNYLVAPLLMQYNSRMGMGMHWRVYNNYNYLIDIRYIILIFIVIAGLMLFELIRPKIALNKCSKCGVIIESDKWRICPVCGAPVKSRGGGKG